MRGAIGAAMPVAANAGIGRRSTTEAIVRLPGIRLVVNFHGQATQAFAAIAK